jgi:long-chain fatty acid transport protein
MRLRLLLLLPVFSGLTATAGGFDNGPQGARILGLGGASTAYIGSIAGLSVNPGLLGMWGDSITRVSLGGLGQIRRSSFIGQDNYQRTDQRLAVLPGGYFYATRGLTSKVAVGLSVTTPYGYHTLWPDNWQGRSVIQESQLNTYFVQPTASFKINESFSAGVGVVYAFGKYSQRRALGQYDDPAAQTGFSSSGSGFGVNLGLYGRTGDNLAFGISYRSGVKLNMKNGIATATGIPERDAALFPATSSFTSELNLPSTLAVGITDRITNNLLLTFDFTLSGWSTLDSLTRDIAASGNLPASRVSIARRYEDALAFRIGSEYKVNDKLTVLAGVKYDETPIRDEYINPEFVDANRLGGSTGLSYQLSNLLAVEAAYAFDYGQLRRARANPQAAQVANVSGSYRTATHTASLGVALSF